MAGRDASTFPAADEDYFHDMDGGVPLTPEEVKGRNIVDRLDRRQRSLLGRHRRHRVRRPRFPEDGLVASEPEGQPRQPLGISRPRQRAVLRQADRPDPKRYGLWLDQRSRRLPARPVRERAEVSRVSPIGARGKTIRDGLVLRRTPPASSGCGCFRIRTSTRRPRKAWDAERYYTDPAYYNSKRAGAAVPRRHVVRLLPRRAESDQSAGGSRTTRSGRTSAPMSARSTSGSTGSSTGTPIATDFVFQLFHTSRPGLARHLADLDRQHQQSADDERGLPAAAAAGCRASAGARKRWPAAGSTTASSTTS